MTAKLQVSAGPNKGQVLMLEETGRIAIGRGDKVELRLTDPTVSRAHCVIDCYGDRMVLKDTGSSSGTRVNGKPITEHTLKPGDVINLGASELRFQAVAAQPEPKE